MGDDADFAPLDGTDALRLAERRGDLSDVRPVYVRTFDDDLSRHQQRRLVASRLFPGRQMGRFLDRRTHRWPPVEVISYATVADALRLCEKPPFL